MILKRSINDRYKYKCDKFVQMRLSMRLILRQMRRQFCDNQQKLPLHLSNSPPHYPITMSATETEKSFATVYLKLVGLSNEASGDQFNSTSDYGKLKSLGPSLPMPKTQLPHGTNTKEEVLIELSIKSIKPPFKFNKVLGGLALSSSVYNIKSQLIEAEDSLRNANVEPLNLKFMFKSKVLQDSTSLEAIPSIASGVSFNCMVSAPTPKPVVTEVSEEADPEVSEPIVIAESTWTKIHQVLKNDLGSEEKANQVLAKLQTMV